MPYGIKENTFSSNCTGNELVYPIPLFALPQFEQGIYRTLSFFTDRGLLQKNRAGYVFPEKTSNPLAFFSGRVIFHCSFAILCCLR